MGFSGSSAGKESACNAGNPGLIIGSGRSSGEGTGYPFQYSWASLMAHNVKNPPAMLETWVQSLGWEDSLEEGIANPLQYSCLENPHCSLRKAFLSLCAVLWISAFRRVYIFFSPLPLPLFFSQLFVRSPESTILPFCISFC